MNPQAECLLIHVTYKNNKDYFKQLILLDPNIFQNSYLFIWLRKSRVITYNLNGKWSQN